jgi:hypothetical protein
MLIGTLRCSLAQGQLSTAACGASWPRGKITVSQPFALAIAHEVESSESLWRIRGRLVAQPRAATNRSTSAAQVKQATTAEKRTSTIHS